MCQDCQVKNQKPNGYKYASFLIPASGYYISVVRPPLLILLSFNSLSLHTHTHTLTDFYSGPIQYGVRRYYQV